MNNINNFNEILQSYNIKASCVNHQDGENYFYYDVKLMPKGKVKDLQKYSNELSLALKTACKPSFQILHDQGIIRLEFINRLNKTMNLFDMFATKRSSEGKLNCLLGQGVDGKNIYMDLDNNPHMIVAGTTGSGKSVLLHNIIANILCFSQSQLLLMDPKNIEFIDYDKSSIKNVSVGYTYIEAIQMLDNLLETMNYRYQLLRRGFDQFLLTPIVFIVDEFADLIMQDQENAFYDKLCQLAQKCRAAKIYIILATQRPSVDIINGTIKANFPARISCRVANHVDSRIVLDSIGAENLSGNGDALLKDNFRLLERFQVAYTNPQEICKYLNGK